MTFSIKSLFATRVNNAEASVKKNAAPAEKFNNDPIRTTNQPDTVGQFYDPMSCGGASASYDVTNTGA